MTFDEKRQELLAEMSKVYLEIREVVSDPSWRNLSYPKFVEAMEDFNDVVKAIHQLNNVEAS